MRSRSIIIAVAISMLAVFTPGVAGATVEGAVAPAVAAEAAPSRSDTFALQSAAVRFPVGQQTGPSSGEMGTSSSWEIVYEPILGASGQSSAVIGEPSEQPQFTVGFGWYVYVYFSRGDWIYLAGLGLALGSTALCLWLAPFLGPYACTTAAFIVSAWIVTHTAPASGYCREFKFTYGYPVLVGVKDVRRSY